MCDVTHDELIRELIRGVVSVVHDVLEYLKSKEA